MAMRIGIVAAMAWAAIAAGIVRGQAPADAVFESYRAHLAAADSAMRLHEAGTARGWLDRAPEPPRGWEWRHLNARADLSLATFRAGETPIHSLALSADGKTIAAPGGDGVVRLLDAVTGAVKSEIKAHSGA